MTDTLTTLPAHSPTAERALFALYDWVCIGTGTGAQTATVTAVANKQHVLQKAVVSFSAAPASPVTFTVKDGASGTVIFQAEIPANATAPAVYTFEKGLNNTTNVALVGGVGDPGGTTVCTIWLAGIDIRQP